MIVTTAIAASEMSTIARDPNGSVRTPACAVMNRIGRPEAVNANPTAAAEPVTSRTYQPSAA